MQYWTQKSKDWRRLCSDPRTWVHRSFCCNFFENEPIATKFWT